jgi:hypothetical protein
MKNSFLIFISLSFLLSACSNSKKLTSAWQSNTFNCNGIPDEWSNPLRYSSMKLQYEISNDAQNLYFCLKSIKSFTADKMMSNGFKLWIDTTSKKKEKMGLIFKSKMPEQGDLLNMLTTNQLPDKKTRKQKMNGKMMDFTVKGFRNIPDGQSSIKTSNLKAVSSFDDSSNIIIEIMVPLNEIYKNPVSLKDTLKTFSFGICINAAQSSGGFGPGGDGPPMGMPMDGPPPGMMRPDGGSDDLYTIDIFWQKVKLSFK